MKTTLGCLFADWPGKFGLTYQEIIADPLCNWVLGCCGNWGSEKLLHLNQCADSGIVIHGHMLARAGDWYEWIKC